MKEDSRNEILERYAEHQKKAAAALAKEDWEEVLYQIDQAKWCIAFIERDTRREQDET